MFGNHCSFYHHLDDSGSMQLTVATDLSIHAAWILLAAFVVSVLYETFRASVKKNISKYDNWNNFLKQNGLLYVAAAIVISLLFLRISWAPVVALVFCIVLIGIGIFYYSPRILLTRQPSWIDWLENTLYLGLVFSAATVLVYALVI